MWEYTLCIRMYIVYLGGRSVYTPGTGDGGSILYGGHLMDVRLFQVNSYCID